MDNFMKLHKKHIHNIKNNNIKNHKKPANQAIRVAEIE